MPTKPKRWAPLVEVAILALAGAALNVLVWPRDPGFMSLAPHPMLLVTLLVLARYGLHAGLAAALVFAVEYVCLVALLGQGLMHDYLFTPGLTTPLVLLVPTTVFLGMLVERHLDRARRAEQRAERLAAEAEAVARERDELRDINGRLGDKVLHADTTMVMVLEQLKALSTLDRDELGQAVPRLMVETLRVSAASLWDADGKGARLRAWQGERPPRPFRADATLERLFAGRDVLALSDVAPAARGGLPLLLGRVRAGVGGPLCGYLAVDELPFAASAQVARLFPLVVEWMSIATGNAVAFGRLAAERSRLKALP